MIDDLKKAAEDPIREAAKRMMEDFNAAFGDLSPTMRIAIWSSMTALKLIDLCAEAELAEMKERGLEPDPLAILRVAHGAAQVMDKALRESVNQQLAKKGL